MFRRWGGDNDVAVKARVLSYCGNAVGGGGGGKGLDGSLGGLRDLDYVQGGDMIQWMVVGGGQRRCVRPRRDWGWWGARPSWVIEEVCTL